MQPEISQRCSSCGAAIREPAMFCPECGKSLATDSEPAAAAEPSQAEQQSTANESSSETENGETPSESATVDEAEPPATAEESPTPEPVAAAEEEAKPPIIKPAAEHPGKVERTREKLHRASNAARGALKENVKRVDNIRHASSAVIEEATYDPSLRFVLVALGLFVVALILLILSKVMG